MSDESPVLEDFGKSIQRLEEVLNLKKTEIIRDSAIKRFELCFDLSWKSIKLYSKKQGIECYSPRACFKTAFQLKLIDYNEQWLKMLDERNLTTHVYREKTSVSPQNCTRSSLPNPCGSIYKQLGKKRKQNNKRYTFLNGQEYAEQIYSRLPDYLNLLKKTSSALGGLRTFPCEVPCPK